MSLRDLNRVMIRRNRHKAEKAGRIFNRLKPVGFGLLLLFSLILAAGVIAAAGLYVSVTDGLPSVEAVNTFFDPDEGLILQPSRLYDRTGQTELITLDNPGSVRAYVWLDPSRDVHFSPLLAQAVVILNQPDFWQSSGVDWKHYEDPAPRTLAENLVSRLLLWQEGNSPRRAIRMRLLAWQLTSTYGREKVLEWYLNSASFGRQITGAESAARVYFGISSAELNEAEVALLAGLSTAPALNPHDSPAAAQDLLFTTLEKLVASGLYSDETRQQAINDGLTIQSPADSTSVFSPAFTRLALQQLSRLVSDDRVALGGLQIRTTLDLVQQEQLECVIKAQLNRLEISGVDATQNCAAARLLPALPPIEKLLPEDTQAAGILLDPSHGEILALTGKTTQESTGDIYESMQGGTILSPFLAAVAFSRGYSPASMVWDLPPESTDGDEPLTKEIALQYNGPVRLRTALISDRLIPLTGMLETLGAENTWRLTKPLGITSLENAYAPEKLLESGGSVSLPEIAQGVSVFANLGDQYGLQLTAGETLQPSTLLAVEDSYGKSLFEKEPIHRQTVISAQLAYLVHDILSDEALRRSELGYPNPFELGRPAGAKYGSAADGKEIWAAGYTQQRAAVIWMGISDRSNETASFPDSLGVKAVGGVWNAIMRQSLTGQPASDWSMPAGISKVVVCDPSGMIPTRYCPSRVTEIFLNGSEPVSADYLFQGVPINRETGNIATVFTPPGLVEDGVYMSVPENALGWAKAAGIALAPTDYDTIQTGRELPDVKISQPVLFSQVGGTVEIEGTADGEGFKNYRVQIGEGLNPTVWEQIAEGTTSIIDGCLAEWDTTGRNGLFAIRLSVVREDNTIQTALSQVTVDNTPPEISILSPQESGVSGARPVFMLADVNDAAGISSVEWSLDGEVVGKNTVAPFSYEWETPVRGKHILVVTAEDAAGNRSQLTREFFVE